jgi:hypothetical protein
LVKFVLSQLSPELMASLSRTGHPLEPAPPTGGEEMSGQSGLPSTLLGRSHSLAGERFLHGAFGRHHNDSS